MKKEKTFHTYRKDFQVLQATALKWHDLLKSEFKYCEECLKITSSISLDNVEDSIERAIKHFNEAKYCMDNFIATIRKMQDVEINCELHYHDDEEDN